MNLEYNEETFCKICNLQFVDKDLINFHLKAVHDHNSINTKIEKFPQTEGQNSNKCEIGDTKFSSKKSLDTHIVAAHEEKKLFECQICISKFSCKQILEKHIFDIHKEQKSHECHICKFKFKQTYELNRHVLEVHEKTRNCNPRRRKTT